MTFDDLAEAARDICRSTTGTMSDVARCLWYCFDRGKDPYDVIRDIIENILESADAGWHGEREDEDKHEH